ncbi:MAG: 6-phosphofructokinase [Candidatus Magasanikbacteria bacterium]|nr:6-phosphofructokinase [Candidatus Magasanikbacteria bacterium]
MKETKTNALVIQAGGPTAVINQTLAGVVLEIRKYPQVSKIYGARHGIAGVVKHDFMDLTDYPADKLELIAKTPGSALGSTRDKADDEYCKKIFAVLKTHNIKYLFFIGGNDSASNCGIINAAAEAEDYELRVIHAPKTIDNDLLETDHCPGFGSAAKFVASAFAGVNLDNASLPGVYIGVVMGRHAGFLTASSILAKKYPDDGPHLIYLPEKPFNIIRFVEDVKNVFEKHGRCIAAVSEGVADEDGVPIAIKLSKQIERDAHGNVQLSGSGMLGDLLADEIKAKAGIKRVRADTLGYLQRSFLGCVSETDAKEAREVGVQAVRFAMSGDVDGSVVIKRAGDYKISYELVDLSRVAVGTKAMPDEFINGANGVTQAFINYLKPLVGELPSVEKLEAKQVQSL